MNEWVVADIGLYVGLEADHIDLDDVFSPY